MTRALILDGALLGRTPTASASLLRLRSGETVFGRQVRLLAARGVTEYTVVTGANAELLEAEVSRPELARLRFRYLPAGSLGDNVVQLREFAAAGQLLVVADDLVFTSDLIDLLLDDSHAQVTLCDGDTVGGPRLGSRSSAALGASGLVDPGGDAALRVLARDGILDLVGAGLTGGASRGFWPLLKLSGAAAEVWLEQVAGRRGEADAVIAGLNRVAAELAISVRPIAGPCVARADQTASFADIAERIRLADLQGQRVISEPRGYAGLGAELAGRGIDRVLLVGDPGYERRDIARYVEALNLEVVRFSEFSAVPTWQEILVALRAYQASRCQGVLSVGDAAAISVGKLVKVYANAVPSDELIDQLPAFSLIAHFTVPAAGSWGTESTTDAVIEVDGELRQIRQDCLLPDLVILDSTLWAEDSERHRRSAVLEALSQSIGSVCAPAATDESRQYALQSLNLLLDVLFDFVKGDVPQAQQSMMTAVHLAGKATTLTGPTIIDALSHLLASDLRLERGEAAAFALPAVWRQLVQQLPSVPDTAQATAFRSACDLLRACLGAENVQDAIVRTERIIDLLRPPDAVGDVSDRASTGVTAAIDLELSPLPLTLATLHAVYAEARASAVRQPPERADFDVLARFGAFCRARKLTFYLFGQTLRDAVTIRRLSPWSGPITVAMPRASYDKLVRWRDQLPPELWLDDAEVNPGRSHAWSRVVGSGGTRPSDPDALPGVTIRILESANYGSSPSQLIRRFALSVLHRATLAAERGAAPQAAGVIATADRFAGRLGTERLGRLRTRLTQDARRRRGVHTYVDPGLTSEFARSQYLAVWFGRGGEQTLGDQVFRAPTRAEAVLNRRFGAGYGDARAIPVKPVPPVPVVGTPVRADPPVAAVLPFVSVIVPVYNVEQYLPACLDSLCLQDTRGYEIIAVDDGSPDGSYQILQDYQQRFPEILRVVRKPHGGLADARNHGMQFARGEYLGFVDSDDLVMPGMIRLMKQKAADTDADIVVCKHAEYWAESNRTRVRWMSHINSYGHSVSERPELLIAARPYACNKIYRRRLFDDYGISYPKGQAFEDSATTFNLMLHANRIEYVDEVLYLYRMDRAGSITNTFNEKFHDIFKSFDSIREFYTRHDRYEEFHDEISELMRRTSFARLSALETCREPARVEAFLTAVYDYLDRHAPDWAQNPYFQRQMAKPKYHSEPKYRAMHSRTLMLKYLEQVWRLNERRQSRET